MCVLSSFQVCGILQALLVGSYRTCSERVAVFVFASLCVLPAAAASLRVLSFVPLDKAIQASHRTPPQRGP